MGQKIHAQTLNTFPNSRADLKKIQMLLLVEFRLLILFTALSIGAASIGSAAELGVNIYGLSHHFDRRDVSGYKFNERNYGLGADINLYQSGANIVFGDLGIFNDSYRYTAKYCSMGYKRKLISGLTLGAVLGIYDSESIGGTVLAPAPYASLRVSRLEVSCLYLMAAEGINNYPSLGFYGTIHLLRFPVTGK